MSPASPLSVRLRALGVVSCLALVAVACGDDDDTTTAADGETASADVDAYCSVIEEIDSQDGPPTEAQLLRVKEIRPDAVGEDADAVVDAFIAAEGDVGKVFSDPEMEERFGRMEAHDAEVCGFETPEDEEDEPETEAAEGAEVVPVTAVDFAFQGIPSEVPAGPVAFELTNDGDAAHEMVIFELGEGADMNELLAAEEPPTEEQAREVGGTFAPPGEGGVYANVDLDPGTYAVVCFIPGPEGKPHYELGMKSTFEVG